MPSPAKAGPTLDSPTFKMAPQYVDDDGRLHHCDGSLKINQGYMRHQAWKLCLNAGFLNVRTIRFSETVCQSEGHWNSNNHWVKNYFQSGTGYYECTDKDPETAKVVKLAYSGSLDVGYGSFGQEQALKAAENEAYDVCFEAGGKSVHTFETYARSSWDESAAWLYYTCR